MHVPLLHFLIPCRHGATTSHHSIWLYVMTIHWYLIITSEHVALGHDKNIFLLYIMYIFTTHMFICPPLTFDTLQEYQWASPVMSQ